MVWRYFPPLYILHFLTLFRRSYRTHLDDNLPLPVEVERGGDVEAVGDQGEAQPHDHQVQEP